MLGFRALVKQSSRRLCARTLSTKMSGVEDAKRKAAYAAVDEFVKDNFVVGIGSGSTVVYAVERIAERVKTEGLKLVCLPSSFQARQLIVENNLVLGDFDRYPVNDVTIDGADEIDAELNAIKGGGGCHLQEKILASTAKQFVIIADFRKDSKKLGEQWKKGVPIEVVPMALAPVTNKLKELGCVPKLRMAVNKAGPVVTDNGNLVIDADFGIIVSPATLEQKLSLIPGIVETGLFINMAVKAFIGNADGSVTEHTKAPHAPIMLSQ
eukprot:Colp12_sorted_trinity150504_noHs@19418